MSLLITAALLTPETAPAAEDGSVQMNVEQDTITMLAPESEAFIFESLAARYGQEFPGQTVVVIAAPDDKYEETLMSMVSETDTPTLFRSYPGIEEQKMARFDTLTAALDMDAYLFISRYDELFPDHKKIPLTFFAPVCYANDVLIDAPPTVLESLEHVLSLDAAILIEKDALGAYLAVLDPNIGIGGEIGAGTESIADITELMLLLRKNRELAGTADPIYLFYDDRLPYVVSTTSRLRDVQERLPGYYSVLPVYNRPHAGAAGVSVFTDLWCIDAGASENKQLAAQQFMGFLLSDYAQNVLTIQNNTGIPINRKMFERYIEFNGDLAYLKDDVESSRVITDEWPVLKVFAEELSGLALTGETSTDDIMIWIEEYL
jgi:hypothetical protein